jgi:hypothetical protein
MSQYSMTCSCGDTLSAEASSRDEAVKKIQGMMTADAISAHMTQKHPGQPIPSVADIHGQISQYTHLAAA